MKKILGFIILILTINSCDNNDREEILCCTNVDFGLEIIVANLDGTNILDTVDGIASTDIKLFYKVENDWVQHFGYDQRNAKGMKVIEYQNGEKRLHVALTPNYDNRDMTEIKLQFSENDYDIIRGEIDFSNGNTICIKVWCNDILKWEAYTTDRVITLVK